MVLLHADKEEADNSLLNRILEDNEIAYTRLSDITEVISFLENNSVNLLVVGEVLDNGTGLELINLVNNSANIVVPTILIVDSKESYHLDHYTSLGVSDCVLRSDLTHSKIQNFINLLNEQKKIGKGMASLSVAVIDDSQLSLKVVSSILKENGITDVKLFNDPVGLLKNYQSYDLFLIDIIMPGITGDKLVGMIRKMSPKSIIIAMSTVDNVKTISNVLSVGADDYVVKPFNKVELLARIRTNFRSFKLLKELESKNIELEILSKTDSLTGAYNHGHIVSLLNDEIKNSRNNGIPLTLAMIDLDHFKKVNDRYGHGVGDEVLIKLTTIFQHYKGSCHFGRYGGEEFIFLMVNKELGEGYKILEELSQEFSNAEFGGIYEPLTFSAGLVQWDSYENEKEILKRADDLLYLSKERGRNQISK